MNNQLLLTLRPNDPYFFGGEQTFGELASYFAQSRLLPQQSTLCGIVRHLLLQQGFQRGDHSFQPAWPTLDTGDLTGLSPLFLARDDGRFFLPLPFDRQEAGTPYTLKNRAGNGEFAVNSFYNSPQGLWEWEGYDPKATRQDAWISDNGGCCVESDQIFIPLTRPGITKVRAGAQRQNEDGFYKQTMYCLAPGWSFAVLARFKPGVTAARLHGASLPAGAEKTVFSIHAVEESRSFFELFDPLRMFYPNGVPADGYTRIVLCSDAFADTSLYRNAVAGVTDSVDFRHIHTSPKVTNYAPMTTLKAGEKPSSEAAQLQKSSKYSLLSRSSVLAVDPAGEALQQLKNALDLKPWKTYGFNHFFTIE